MSPAPRRRRRSVDLTPWLTGALLVVTATVAIGLVVVALNRPAPVSAALPYSYSPPRSEPSATPTSEAVPPPTLGDALRSDRPVNIAVIGDSTGFEETQWVRLLTGDVSATGRAVQYALWNEDTVAYDPALSVGDGQGAPVTFWNGSATGEPPAYSQENLSALLPADVPLDAIVINHGFNTAGDGVVDISRLADDVAAARPDTPLFVTIQNPRTVATVDEQNAKHQAQLDWLGGHPSWKVVDVFAAFTAQPDLSALYKPGDDRHPNEAGGRLWADTFRSAAGI